MHPTQGLPPLRTPVAHSGILSRGQPGNLKMETSISLEHVNWIAIWNWAF